MFKQPLLYIIDNSLLSDTPANCQHNVHCQVNLLIGT